MSNKILVLNGRSYGNVAEGLGELVYRPYDFFSDPNSFKLILFTGGEDVSPELYGDTSPRYFCGNNKERDIEEKYVFDLAKACGIKMTGICRGVQFLNVMSGGRMMHDITNHGGRYHTMITSVGLSIRVNSYHHQMILPAEDAEVIGWSDERLSKHYIGNMDAPVVYKGKENEAAIFPKTKAFGVQYHPESMPEDSDGYDYYRKMIINALELPWEEFVTAYTKGLENVEFFTMRKHGSTTTG